MVFTGAMQYTLTPHKKEKCWHILDIFSHSISVNAGYCTAFLLQTYHNPNKIQVNNKYTAKTFIKYHTVV
jgi:hypothetical protein